MRRILSLSALALVLTAGVAMADRGGGGRDHRGGGSSYGSRGNAGVGSHRGGSSDYNRGGGYNRGGSYNRGGGYNRGSSYSTGGHRDGYGGGYVRSPARRSVYLNNGRYDFGGGVSFGWRAPVTTRHYDYRSRPMAIAESPQPVAGYIWVPGQWRWSGYEWTWSAGYYQPDPAYPTGSGTGYPPGYGGYGGY